MPDTLYNRLGGYDAIAAVCDDLLIRLQADARLARFSSAGGPLYYVVRDMRVCHRGLRIDEGDWQAFLGHLDATLDNFEVPAPERAEVLSFINSTKAEIVE